jgi:hypothetical protein
VTYLLDANVFIQAKNLHYGLDFCPAFWEWLLDNNQAGRVFSIDKVADYYLISHALANGHVVITHEVPANSVKRIKIPNACIGLNLRFMTPYEMLRRERARFVLGGAQA